MIRLLVALFVNQLAIALRARSGGQLRGKGPSIAASAVARKAYAAPHHQQVTRCENPDSHRSRRIDRPPARFCVFKINDDKKPHQHYCGACVRYLPPVGFIVQDIAVLTVRSCASPEETPSSSASAESPKPQRQTAPTLTPGIVRRLCALIKSTPPPDKSFVVTEVARAISTINAEAAR